MGTIECSQPTSKSSWDSQDFGDISMVLKMAHFRKSTGPRWVKYERSCKYTYIIYTCIYIRCSILLSVIVTADLGHHVQQNAVLVDQCFVCKQ